MNNENSARSYLCNNLAVHVSVPQNGSILRLFREEVIDADAIPHDRNIVFSEHLNGAMNQGVLKNARGAISQEQGLVCAAVAAFGSPVGAARARKHLRVTEIVSFAAFLLSNMGRITNALLFLIDCSRMRVCMCIAVIGLQADRVLSVY